MPSCEACGCLIEFLVGPRGRMIAVQRVTHVYARLRGTDPLVKVAAETSDRELYVSHFQTCSDPARFSRSKGDL